jgi:methionine synthase I (cobalamin-dependent)
MSSRLLQALAIRPLLLDGGMGTRLIELGLDLRSSDPALWNLSNSEAVAAIHARDIAAGSDVLLSNTFGANASWLDRYGRIVEMAAINQSAVALARTAAGPDRFVLGTIGPTAGSAEVYRAQAEVLVEAGVDGLLLETHGQSAALLGLDALRSFINQPILVSLASWPLETRQCARRLVEAGADVLGINCVEPDRARNWVQALGRGVPVPLLWKPSVSHPSARPVTPARSAQNSFPTLFHEEEGILSDPIREEDYTYAVTPEKLALGLTDLITHGVRLFGGCCGATEVHIATLRSALDLQRALGV